MFEVGETAYVVVEEGADPSWGTGPFTTNQENHGSIYVQPVNLDATPRGREWVGRSLRVSDEKGTACLATVRELKLFVITEERYVDEDDPEVKELLETHDLDTARALYLMRDQPPTLVGRLDGCAKGVATPTSEPEPLVYVRAEVDPAFEARALTAARALPAYPALQARWEAMWQGASEGEELEPGEQPGEWSGGIVSSFGTAGGPQFVTVLFSSSGCGFGLAAELFGLYRVGPKGELSLLTTASTGPLPELLLDVDHDGALEIYRGNSGEWLGTLYGVLYAEGSGELLGSITRLPPVGEALPAEAWGPAHELIARLGHDVSPVMPVDWRFDSPKRFRGRLARGSDLLNERALRELLSWPKPHQQPGLAIVLVDSGR